MIDEPLAILAEAFGQEPEPHCLLAEQVKDSVLPIVSDPIAAVMQVGPAHIILAPVLKPSTKRSVDSDQAGCA